EPKWKHTVLQFILMNGGILITKTGNHILSGIFHFQRLRKADSRSSIIIYRDGKLLVNELDLTNYSKKPYYFNNKRRQNQHTPYYLIAYVKLYRLKSLAVGIS